MPVTVRAHRDAAYTTWPTVRRRMGGCAPQPVRHADPTAKSAGRATLLSAPAEYPAALPAGRTPRALYVRALSQSRGNLRTPEAASAPRAAEWGGQAVDAAPPPAPAALPPSTTKRMTLAAADCAGVPMIVRAIFQITYLAPRLSIH
eukprot:scaffold389_cov382-Prasinococcus_capsulatus_cf.AAC.19